MVIYYICRTCVFKALHLFFLPNFPGPTFIPCPTSIPKARVVTESKGMLKTPEFHATYDPLATESKGMLKNPDFHAN